MDLTVPHLLHSSAKQHKVDRDYLPIFRTPVRSSVVPVQPAERQWQVIAAGLKKPLEGISEELNSIAMQNLDYAPARRRVRSAFVDIHRNLNHPLFKMAPAEIQTEEWYERNSKGYELFCKRWMSDPGKPVKGALLFSHGYGDTCTFFFDGIARRLAACGYCVYALDHPGFGLSQGLHGYIPDFDELADNVIFLSTKIKEKTEITGLPFFMLGQSMGGAVAIKAHFKQPHAWDGIILIAPMCKIAEGVMPPALLLKALKLMSIIMPKAKLFPFKDLTDITIREPQKRGLAYYNVVCYNDQMRLKTAVELINATIEIESKVEQVSSPLLVLHGAADKVTDPKVSKFLYERASSNDKTLKLYDGGYHSILEGEPDDRIYALLDDIVAWLDSRCLKS